MNTVNVFIALSQPALNILKPLLDDNEYDGQHLTAVKIFRKMADRGVVQRMFRADSINPCAQFWPCWCSRLDCSRRSTCMT